MHYIVLVTYESCGSLACQLGSQSRCSNCRDHLLACVRFVQTQRLFTRGEKPDSQAILVQMVHCNQQNPVAKYINHKQRLCKEHRIMNTCNCLQRIAWVCAFVPSMHEPICNIIMIV